LKRVRDAGLVGMGGAAFPTHVKLNPPKGKTIEFVIANAAECEPYLTVDKQTMEESPDRLVDGMLIAMQITSALKGIIALEENKKELIPALEKAIGEKASGKIEITVCKTKYPQGGEKNIVQATVGREIPSGGLPADIGCVIQNVGTLCAISDAFRLGKPLIDRALTVSGLGLENPQNIVVPIGTVIKELEGETIKPKADEVVKVIAGGPMMGTSMPNSDFPVGKNTSGVLYLTAKETYVVEETPCLGCGKCTEACSCRLNPVLIVRALKAEDTAKAIKFGLLDCVECGACAYVCPAHIALVQHFRVGKALARQQKAAADAKAKAAAEKGGK
jgi:electron transport complex protein RnfC